MNQEKQMENNELSDELSLQPLIQDDNVLSILFPKLENVADVQFNPLLKKNNKKVSIYLKAKDLAQGRDRYALDESGSKCAVEVGVKINF